MRTDDTTYRILRHNLMWLGISMLLAFAIWVIATLESDPMRERVFMAIPVELVVGEGLIATGQTPANVSVTVRAPQSIMSLMSNQDISVQADLSGLGPGTHRAELRATLARRAISDTTPRQVTVTLEQAREQFIEVSGNITAPPPRGYEVVAQPVFEVNQVLVSGPVSRVEEVVAVQVDLDLSQQRTNLNDAERLVAVDVDGSPVSGVTLDPAVVQVQVQIQPRTDIREIRVVPNLNYDSLPEGYAPTVITVDPDTVIITGAPENLENAPGAFFTEPIDLTGRTTSFEYDIGIQIPDRQLFLVGNQFVTVSVGITPLVSSRQFDDIPVEIIGLVGDLQAVSTPAEVTVLLTGPQITLDVLEAANLRVVVDVNGLGPGNYQLVPDVSVMQGQTAVSSIAVLPSEIAVLITQTAEATPTPDG